MTDTQAESTSLRIRVNVETTVKGVKTWSCTVEGTSDLTGQGYDMEAVLKKSDELVAALEKRYPPTSEPQKPIASKPAEGA